ncbi:hypothetical protein [Paracoccus aminovorans]|uniref:hypothetical protein n=1 Tax=Paracoccus aminovorans TaxID=34004 RepID=UPI0009E7F23D|nr:hypothetical protein [Paracoccus aminovorans]
MQAERRRQGRVGRRGSAAHLVWRAGRIAASLASIQATEFPLLCMDQEKILDTIDPEKDVDGFHISNVGRLTTGQKGMVPCIPLSCLMLLREKLGDISRLNAIIVSNLGLDGWPMAQLLLARGCSVTIAHHRSRNTAELCRMGDIVIANTGRPKGIKGIWIRPGATIIDIGVHNIIENGRSRLVGDVDFASAAEVAGAITVPGGVHRMATVCLLTNTLM